MEPEQPRFQIVFLLDENSKDRTNQRARRYVNTVRSTILKLLTHFSNIVEEDAKHLQWSYKFYESHSSKKRPIKKHFFKEFNLTTFEEFENEVETRILPAGAGILVGSAQQPATGVELSQDTLDGDPLENLRTALSEVSFDYPWDKPDILSPVKPLRTARNRNRRQAAAAQSQEDSGKHNLLFLFTPCPVSIDEVRKLADCDDKKGLLTSILPRQLQVHFWMQNRIRLFWVLDDPCLGDTHPTRPTDCDGIKVVNQFLKEVNGCIVPAAAVVSTGSSSLSQCTRLSLTGASSAAHDDHCEGGGASDARPHCDIPLPISSAVAHYINRIGVQTDKVSTANFIWNSGSRRLDFTVHIKAIHDDKASAGPRPNMARGKTEEAKVSTASLMSSVQSSDSNAIDERQFQFEAANRRTAKSLCKVLNSHVTLSAIGTIGRCRIPVDCYDPGMVYIVTADSQTDLQFHRVLSQLDSNNIALIAEFRNVYGGPALCLLQPLTSVSGTLSMIKSSMEVNLLKRLTFASANMSAASSQQANSASTGLQAFVAKCCQGILPPSSKPDASTADVGSCEADPHTSAPVSSCVESWYSAEAGGSNTERLISFLQGGNTTESEAASILRQLQRGYKGRKNKLLYGDEKTYEDAPEFSESADKPTQSPRKRAAKDRRKVSKTPKRAKQRLTASPRKAMKRTPLRRSPRKAVRSRYGETTARGPKARGSNMPSRGDLILEKSKAARLQQDEEENTSEAPAVDVPGAAQAVVGFLECTTEEELLSNINNIHCRWIEGEGSPIVCAKTILHSVIQYAENKTEIEADRKDIVLNLLKTVILTHKTIREEYLELDKESKLREFQLQIHIHLEVIASGISEPNEEELENIVNEVSMMLRGISFIRDNYINNFMQTNLLYNYVERCPGFLYKVYEDVGLAIPSLLERFAASSDEESVPSVRPRRSVQPKSSVPSNLSMLDSVTSRRRSANLPRYNSFDVVAKRQIAISGVTKKPNDKNNERRSARIASATKSGPLGSTGDVRPGRACRNLFQGELAAPKKLERRQSVAVMQGAFKTPTKEKKGSGQRVLKTKMVAETPAHKQRSNTVWRRLEMQRRHERTVTDVEVVQDSPVKAVSSPEKLSLRRSPRKPAPAAKLMRRTSFYTDKEEFKSRNVEKYTKLEERLCKPLLSPTWRPGQKLLGLSSTTPRRIKPTKFLSSLYEESPTKPAPATVAAASRTSRSLSAIFSRMDSPSKNTRLQAARIKSPEFAFGPPGGGADSRGAGGTTPKKNLMGNFRTPVKSPTRSPAVRGPSSAAAGTSTAGIAGVAKPPATKPCGQTDGPRPRARSPIKTASTIKRRMFLSPERPTTNQRPVPLSGALARGYEEPRSASLLLSPSRCTRSQTGRPGLEGRLLGDTSAPVAGTCLMREAVGCNDGTITTSLPEGGNTCTNTGTDKNMTPSVVSGSPTKPVRVTRRVSLQRLDSNVPLKLSSEAFLLENQTLKTKSTTPRPRVPVKVDKSTGVRGAAAVAGGATVGGSDPAGHEDKCEPEPGAGHLTRRNSRMASSRSFTLAPSKENEQHAQLQQAAERPPGGEQPAEVGTRKRKLSPETGDTGANSHAAGTPGKRRRTTLRSTNSFSFAASFGSAGGGDVFDESREQTPLPPAADMINHLDEVSNVSVPSVGGDDEASNASAYSLRDRRPRPLGLLRSMRRGSKLGSSGSGSNLGFAAREGSSSLLGRYSSGEFSNSSSAMFDLDAAVESPSFGGLRHAIVPPVPAATLMEEEEEEEEEEAHSPVFTSPCSRRNQARTSSTVSSASKYQSPHQYGAARQVMVSPVGTPRYSRVTSIGLKQLIESPILEAASSSTSSSGGQAASVVLSPGSGAGRRPVVVRGRSRRALSESYKS